MMPLLVAVLFVVSAEAPRVPLPERRTSARLAEIAILAADRAIQDAERSETAPPLAAPKILLAHARRAFEAEEYEAAWRLAQDAREAVLRGAEAIDRTPAEPAVPEPLFALEAKVYERRAFANDTSWRVAAAEDLLLTAQAAYRRGDLEKALEFAERGFRLLTSDEARPDSLPPTSVVDLNSAPRAALESLPGITPERAEDMLWFRRWIGFRRLEDLLFVPGFNERIVMGLRGRVRVGPNTAKSSRALELRLE